ncbi:MAG: hypothetical protein LBP36_02585 [Oscillospiraceae bacterium]|jgi:hypothetical protein|nr:hypothetical protein [Oscillospiraceae bacterium]
MALGRGLLGQVVSRMLTTVQSQINGIAKWTLKVSSALNTISQRIQEKISNFIHQLLKKPKSKDDYWKIGGYYLAKRLVMLTLASVGASVFLYMNVFFPYLDGKLWQATVRTNTKKYLTFSGKAKLFDPSGILIYKGEMQSGQADGYGIQYEYDSKNVAYKGNFKGDKYNGDGELYNAQGQMIYKGAFENNKFQGHGRQLNSFGAITYVGSFDSGLRSGKGTEYDTKTGFKIYYGDFVNNLREGRGVEFASDGETPIYEGSFVAGNYSGSGKQYLDGHLIYSGTFGNGKYNGNGTLYNKSSGATIYEGEFSSGLFEGNGKLYDERNGKILYEGDFVKGLKNGSGKLYDTMGEIVYNGEFKSDSVNFLSIIGKKRDEIIQKFGNPNSTTQIDEREFLFYAGVNGVIINSLSNEAGGEYICERILIHPNQEFMGLSEKITSTELHQKLGDQYSITDFSAPNYYQKAFSLLNVKISDVSNIPSSKYIFDKYYLRLMFSASHSQMVCIEVGSTV